MVQPGGHVDLQPSSLGDDSAGASALETHTVTHYRRTRRTKSVAVRCFSSQRWVRVHGTLLYRDPNFTKIVKF